MRSVPMIESRNEDGWTIYFVTENVNPPANELFERITRDFGNLSGLVIAKPSGQWDLLSVKRG